MLIGPGTGSAAGSSGQPFYTRTDPRQITGAQLTAGAFAVLGAGMSLVNLIWLPFTGDLERLFFVFGGAVVAGLSGWMLRLLRQGQRAELTIALSGVTYTTNGRSRNWGWRDLDALALTPGLGGRILILEDRRTGMIRQRMPRVDTVHRVVTNASPLATLIPLQYLDADEIDIVDAIRRFSRGRFPDPERRGIRIPGVGLGTGLGSGSDPQPPPERDR